MSKKSDFFPVFLLLFASFCFFWFDCSCRLCFTHQSVRIAKRTTKLHHSCVCVVVFLRVQRHKKGQRVKREMRFFSFQKCRERETCAHPKRTPRRRHERLSISARSFISPHLPIASLSLSLSYSLSARARASVVSSSLLIHA